MRINAPSLFSSLHRDKPSVLLCHIPKTGGSSVASAIRRHYLLSNFNIRAEASFVAGLGQYGAKAEEPAAEVACQNLRSALAFYAAAQGTKFITGHLWRPVHLSALQAMGYRAITFLRNPVDRWYSLYFYQRYKEGRHGQTDMDFEEFLASEDGSSAGRMYVRYLGGIRADGDYGSAAAIDGAKEGLSEFDLFGLLEDIPDFCQRFEDRLGLRLHMPHKRKSPANKGEDLRAMMRRYKESPDIRAQVESLCGPDMTLYEHARGILGR